MHECSVAERAGTTLEEEYGANEQEVRFQGSAAAATAELVERTATELNRPAKPTPRSRDVPAPRRGDAARETACLHAVMVVGDHSWGGSAFDGVACRPLMEVAGRPLIAHALDWLTRNGIRSAAICANGHTSPVRQYLGEGHEVGLALQYYTDVMPRGPAGCLLDAAADSGADTLLVLSGMLIPRLNFIAPFRQHLRNDACVTVISGPSPAGELEASGVYLFSNRVLEEIAPTGYQDIKEALLPRVRSRGGRIDLFEVPGGDVLRVTDLESYLLANRRVIEEELDTICGPPYLRAGEAYIHSACEVHPSARFVGPVVVGPGCSIEENAIIVGPTSIGTGCHIGPGAVITRSILWPFSRLGRDALVDNCLLARHSNLQPACQVRDVFWTRDSQSGGPMQLRSKTAGRLHRLAS